MSEVVLLGAGASYGSVRSGARPPLGKDLYAALSKVSPLWQNLPRAAVQAFQGSGQFEQGFGWIRANCDERSIPLLRDMALFFLSFRPRPDNLYVPLLQGARKRSNVQLATLNYDLMIEHCMMHLFNVIVHGPSERGDLGVLKLHGSPNLVPKLGGAQFTDCSFSNNGGSAVSSNVYSWMEPDKAVSWIQSQQSLAPCMALYEAGKYVPIGGNAVGAVQAQFRQAVSTAAKIYVAGTSYQAHDVHVWNPIIESGAKIMVADPYPDSFSALESKVGSRLMIAPISFETFAMSYHDGNI